MGCDRGALRAARQAAGQLVGSIVLLAPQLTKVPWLTVRTQGFGPGLLYALWRSAFAVQTPEAACGCAVACAKPPIPQPLTLQGWDDLLRRENQARRGVVDSHLYGREYIESVARPPYLALSSLGPK